MPSSSPTHDRRAAGRQTPRLGTLAQKGFSLARKFALSALLLVALPVAFAHPKIDKLTGGDPSLAKLRTDLLAARKVIAKDAKSAASLAKSFPHAMREGKLQCLVGVTQHSSELDQACRDAGLEIVSHHTFSADHQVLVVRCTALEQLVAISTRPDVKGITPEGQAITMAGTTTSQADQLIGAADARTQEMVDGSSLVVGVLSNSVNENLGGNLVGTSLMDSPSQDGGDLPPNITVLDAGPTPNSATDEGAAMMEVIYDMAPGCGLAFASALSGYTQFADNIEDLWIAGPQADVLVDNVIYAEEPLYQDGPIAMAANNAAAAGVPYFVAAGNDGNNAHESPYRDVDGGNQENVVPPVGGDDLHAFDGANDTHLEVQLDAGATLTAILKWAEPYDSTPGTFGVGPGAASDLDLYLTSDELLPLAGNILEMSILPQGTEMAPDGDPYEIINYTATGSETVYLVIDHVEGRSPMSLHLTVRISSGTLVDNALTGDRTLQGHALAANVLTVGAVDYTEIRDGGPNFMNQPTSSLGGQNLPILIDAAGMPLMPPAERDKPEISGPDGVNTTFFGAADTDTPADGFPNFFGTSAAAAHLAGVAALVVEGRGGDAAMTDLSDTQAVYDCLTSTADPVADPNVGGAGVVDALGAVQCTNEPTPTNTQGGGGGTVFPSPTTTSTPAPNTPTPTPTNPMASPDCPSGAGVIVKTSPFEMDTVIAGTETYVISLENGIPIIPAGVTVQVINGAKFVIDTPTDVRTLHRSFDVYGTLIVDSPTPVVFEGCSGKRWGAIRIFSDEDQDPSVLRNVTIRGAGGNGSRRAVPFRAGIGLGEGNILLDTDDFWIQKIIELTGNHCLRLSGLPHIVDNVRFQNILGSPIMVDAPLAQSIANVTLPPDYHDPVAGKYDALAIADVRGGTQTLFADGVINLASGGEFQYYHFPIDAQFQAATNLQVSAGAQILMGSRATLTCLGGASFIGSNVAPITIQAASPDRSWGRIELLGSTPQTINFTQFVSGGAPKQVPLFANTGMGRQYAGVGERLAPGCAVLFSEANHTLANCEFFSWQRLLFLQDVRIHPNIVGIVNVQDSLPGAPSLAAIGILDFTQGREEFPIVFADDRILAPIASAVFLYSGTEYLNKGTSAGSSPAYFFDRDVVVPRNFRLTLDGGGEGLNRLVCLFSEREIAKTNQITNLQVGKNELDIVGGLLVNSSPNNRPLLTSTDYRTPLFRPLFDEEAPETEPGDETDMNETDTKRFFDSGEGVLDRLLSDLGFEAPAPGSEDEKRVVQIFEKTLPDPSNAFDWAGVIVPNEADDLETVIENLEIRNAINGVTFLTSSGTVRNCFITNCFGSGISCLERSFATLESNQVTGNGMAGIVAAYGSSPRIVGNEIIGNMNANGVFITEFSNPVLTGNTISGNGLGVFIRSDSAPNLGRIPGHPNEGTTIPVDPGYDTDDGDNSIFANVGNSGVTVNLINNTPNRIFAQNNNWGSTDPVAIQQTIFDQGEIGVVPGLIPNAGPVIILPLVPVGSPTPTEIGATATPTKTRTPTPTTNPNVPTRTPTSTPIHITPLTPTPSPTTPPISSDFNSDAVLSGVVRFATEVNIGIGVTVTILPGTKLVFAEGAGMHVEPNGRIIAQGNESMPIYFMSELESSWPGIFVEGSEFIDSAVPSRFEHCVFQRSSGAALFLQNVKTVVENCEFRDCLAGIQVAGNPRTNPRIRGNHFKNNSFSSIVVSLAGTVGAGVPDSGVFNLGIGRANPAAGFNVDPGFNVFTQPLGSSASDVLVLSWFTNRTFRVEENLFQTEDENGFTTVLAPADVTGSGRVGSAVAVPISVKPAPRLLNVRQENGKLVIQDDEVWGGVVIIASTNRVIEVAEGVTVKVLPGTRVLFNPDRTSVSGIQTTLRVRGTLLSKGKINQPIRFGSIFEEIPGDPTEFDWGGLEFLGHTDGSANLSNVFHTEIRHAAVGVTSYAGDQTFFESVLIENCGETAFASINLTVDENVGFVVKSKGGEQTSSPALNKRGLVKGQPFSVSRPTLFRVFLLGGSRGEFGFYSMSAQARLRRCAFGSDPRRNDYPARPFRRAALLIEGFRVPDLGTSKDPGLNFIAGTAAPGEGKYEVLNSSNGAISAIGNYWLAGSSLDIKNKIFDADEAVSSGRVDVVPFLGGPAEVDLPGGDLDSDAFYFPNDFLVFMGGVTGTIPSDPLFRSFADRDQNHVVDYRDVFLYSLTYHERSIRPPLELPPTATPAPPTPTRTPKPGGDPTPTPTEPPLGTGDVQVTLTWNTDADLDIYVQDPFGDVVSFFNRTVPSGGMLDFDDQGACIGSPGGGPENVFWPDNQAPEGDYLFFVNYYPGSCTDPVTNWSVRVRRTGSQETVINGTLLTPGETSVDYPFTFSDGTKDTE